MNEADSNHDSSTASFSGAPGSTDAADPAQLPELHVRTVRSGIFFGSFVGTVMGALVGAACCWLMWLPDLANRAIVVGGALGLVGGVAIGWKERKSRRPDIATIICASYWLVPALCMLLRGAGVVNGKFSGYLFLGMGFVGPMGGMLLGAILDRAYESIVGESWGKAFGFSAAGALACTWIGFGIATTNLGPDPKDLAWQTRSVILREWHKDPELQSATIEDCTLTYKSGRTYEGSFQATISGDLARFDLEVEVEGEILNIRWQPIDE
jgi:hypothetical protein